MQWKDIKAEVMKLSLEEKIIGASNIVILLSCFLPWSNGRNTEGNIVGLLGVQSFGYSIGYITFIFAALSLVILASGIIRFKLPKFFAPPQYKLLFFGAQSLFLMTIAMLMYMQMGMEFSWIEVRFGLYLGIVAAMSATGMSYMFIQKVKQAESKRKANEIFEHSCKSSLNLQPESHEEDLSRAVNDSRDMYHEAVSVVQDEVAEEEVVEEEIPVNAYQEKIPPKKEQLTLEDISDNR